MAGFVDFPVVPFWFVALPDCESTGPVATLLQGHAAQEINHPCGRPWLLGRWPEDVVTTGQAGHTKIAVIGQHAVTTSQLAQAAGRIQTVADLDRLAGSLVGSSHLVASVGGRVRAQGTITGVRRIFHAKIDGVVVAADRADVLAWLLDAGLDEQRLALYLLNPPSLHPLAGQPVWQGVTLLPTDHYLVLDGDQRDRLVKWWTPPEPVVPMAEGAPALREALSAAVDARIWDRKLVSCDLGGLDSTSVCCLAAHGKAKVVAYTAASRDPIEEDVYWATLTVAGLGNNVEHYVIPADEIPLFYHGVDMDDCLDEPCDAAIDQERWLTIARRAAARGSQLHLTGIGGNELLYGSPAHLHALLRSSPRIALRNLRGFAAKYRWPRGDMLRQLLDNRPYRAWLGEIARNLTAPLPPREEPLLGWGYQPRLPPWVTSTAVDVVKELIRAEARTAEPLAKERGQHRELEMMQFGSRATRQLGQMAARIGVTLATPYYDDRVIEAGLAVRPEERITPWQYKPLILKAMRGIVPDESLTRQTSDDGDCDQDPGLRQNRANLLALCEDSRLGRLGLVDANVLREVCSRPLPPNWEDNNVLRQTVACEVWLRTLEGSTVSSGGEKGENNDVQAA